MDGMLLLYRFKMCICMCQGRLSVVCLSVAFFYGYCNSKYEKKKL